MNPCPCGFAGFDTRCHCGPLLIERYQRRISGPLRDRIDLWVATPRVPAALLVTGPEPETSAMVAERIAAARARQAERPARLLNARIGGRSLRRLAGLGAEAANRLVRLADAEALSGRGTERLLRVARTIADLEGSEMVAVAHLEEAARWRLPGGRELAALAS
jgi:magnesium chelatase family protein